MVNSEQSSSAATTEAGDATLLRTPLMEQPNLARLVEWFVRGLRIRLIAMEHAWRAEAWDELAHLAHQLKGAGASYGYKPISEAAAALETAARENAAQQVPLLHAKLRQQCDAAMRGLETTLDE